MPTGTKKGFNPARMQGQAVNNAGLTTYTIASGYGTALGLGTPVKLVSGNLQIATNGTNCIGVLEGVEYVHVAGDNNDKYWPASATSTKPIYGRVVDAPNATFRVKTDGPVNSVIVGGLYAAGTIGSVDTATGRDQSVIATNVVKTGALAVTGTDNAALSGLANGDTFTIKSTVADVVTTITIVTNQTPAQLLALLNAVPGISAALNGSNFLVVTVTDGGNLVLADGTGTPLADSSLLAVAGTYTSQVALNASMVKVVGIPDTNFNELEVILSNHQLRDNV